MEHTHAKQLRSVLSVIVIAIALTGQSPHCADFPQPTFAPGKTTQMHWPPVKTKIEVFIPGDYSPDHKWPIIFHYHGLNGAPSTAFVQKLTDGKGCIVVGMEYLERGLVRRTAEENDAYQQREMKQLRELRGVLAEQLQIDERRVFISGTSKGGWQVSALLERGVPDINGALILIAGRFPSRAPKPKLDGLPLYIGAGETDPNNPYTRMAAQYFGHCGAEVTYEEYSGKGHAVDAEADALRSWVDVHLCPDREAVKSRAQVWLRERRSAFNTEKNRLKQYEILQNTAENPRLKLCGKKSRNGVERQLDIMREKMPVREEYEAQRLYEKALWKEQSASSLRDLERSLDSYEKTSQRYGKTRYGNLAKREAERVQGFVDEAHARLRTRAPQLPRIRVR